MTGTDGLQDQLPALLFAPGDDERKLQSALRSSADAVIVDLEDAVAPARKGVARGMAAGLLAGPGTANVVVRVNDPRGPDGQADLASLADVSNAVLMVPKARIETLEIVHAAGARSIALVETAAGMLEVEQIARIEGVSGIAIGTIDLAADIGLSELPEGLELLYTRSRVVLACAAAEIAAIDGVCLAVPGGGALLAEARRARALGFQGKMCIHPAQLETVQGAFAPTSEELEHARQVVESYEAAVARGQGATSLGDEMVDLATARRAKRILGHGDVRTR